MEATLVHAIFVDKALKKKVNLALIYGKTLSDYFVRYNNTNLNKLKAI